MTVPIPRAEHDAAGLRALFLSQRCELSTAVVGSQRLPSRGWARTLNTRAGWHGTMSETMTNSRRPSFGGRHRA